MSVRIDIVDVYPRDSLYVKKRKTNKFANFIIDA